MVVVMMRGEGRNGLGGADSVRCGSEWDEDEGMSAKVRVMTRKRRVSG